jgi:hypothetical protein
MLIGCCKTALLLGAMTLTAGCSHFRGNSGSSLAQSPARNCGQREVYICERITTRQECECLPQGLAQMRTVRIGFGR